MNYFDYHLHTTESDGVLTPSQLLAELQAQQIESFFITDHDHVCLWDGITAAGVELSCVWSNQLIHVVGLNLSLDQQAPIYQHCQGIALQRQLRGEKIAERLHKKGFSGALQGALVYADGGMLCRPHFARWMVEQGHVKDIAQAFKKYLGPGKVGDVKAEWPHLTHAVDVINASGGVAVLAHPKQYRMSNTKLKALMKDFRAAGGQAVEVCNGLQSSEEVAYLSQLTLQLELLASAGSDFHGPATPYHQVGRFTTLPQELTPVHTLWR